jgi:hemolysin activation/secretion protein
LNLTRHDDVVTVTVPFSLDFDSLQSGAGSYYLPYRAGKGGSVSIFGGYSEIDSVNLVPGIDLDGYGWFAGGQVGYNLVSDARRQVRLAGGIVFSTVEDTLLLVSGDTAPREVDRVPLSLVLTYAGLQPDAWNGRNSLSLQSMFHRGDFLGSSDDEAFELQRENAPSDYFVERIQFARLQGLGRAPAPDQQWSLFTRVTAQIASDLLIPADQVAMGGRNTVRGYHEREVLGDDGVVASLEARSPVISRDLSWWRGRGGEGPVRQARLQGVTFIDAGMISLQESVAGEEDQVEMLSVGLGFRLSAGRRAQLSFDWGFPMEETNESDRGGRGHFSAQILF